MTTIAHKHKKGILPYIHVTLRANDNNCSKNGFVCAPETRDSTLITYLMVLVIKKAHILS
jgi:hypothetical protein